MDINMDEKMKDKERVSRIQGQIATNKLKIFISGTAELILLITEIYIAIHYKGAFIPMAVFILAMAVGLFFLVNAVIDLTFLCKELEKDNFTDIYRAQKASYLVIRKSFEEMDERLRAIEEASALPADEIINAQKAVAKVTISRSKENTDALMNSNDELINHLFTFEGKLDSNNEMLMSRQKEMLDATKSDIAAQNADLQSKLNNLQMQMQQMESKLEQGVSVSMPQMMAMPQMMMSAPVQTVAPVVEPVAAPVVAPEPTVEVAPMPEPEIVAEPEPIAEPEPEIVPEPVVEAAPEPEPVVEPEPEPAPAPAPEMDDPNKMMSPDDIAALLASMNNDAPAEPEPVVEPEPEPAPAPAPEMDDPNKMMSPDDIAALLASMNADAPAEPEPVAEPEPEPAPAPVEVPTDTGIDLSDPNRVMSPEEIEKLFASL